MTHAPDTDPDVPQLRQNRGDPGQGTITYKGADGVTQVKRVGADFDRIKYIHLTTELIQGVIHTVPIKERALFNSPSNQPPRNHGWFVSTNNRVTISDNMDWQTLSKRIQTSWANGHEVRLCKSDDANVVATIVAAGSVTIKANKPHVTRQHSLRAQVEGYPPVLKDGYISCPRFGGATKKYFFNGNTPAFDSIQIRGGPKWRYVGGGNWQKAGDLGGVRPETAKLERLIRREWKNQKGISIYYGSKPVATAVPPPAAATEEQKGNGGVRAHEEYDTRYLFSDSGDFERINYQRDDASYGGFGTARDFIQLNPNVDYYDRSKVFGYEGHTTPSIDYMLLSVAFVVFMAICCCVVIAVSFTSGYVTKWWLNKKRKTQLEDETV